MIYTIDHSSTYNSVVGNVFTMFIVKNHSLTSKFGGRRYLVIGEMHSPRK